MRQMDDGAEQIAIGPILTADMLRPFFEDAARYLGELQERESELDHIENPVRDEMLRLGFIRPSLDDSESPLPLHAVDSSSHDITLGTLCTCIGLAVDYHDHDRYQIAHRRVSGPNTEAFRHVAGGIRLQLELRLLSAADRLTIADLSFWSLLMDSNKLITAYENLEDGEDRFRDMVDECFASEGPRTLLKTLRNPNVIAMSKIASSSSLCRSDTYRRFFAHEVADRVLMSRVLRPGERTLEVSLKELGSMGLAGNKVNIERRLIDDPDRRAIETAFKSELFVTFYRPWDFHGAYRIEFHRERFPDARSLASLFATIKHATRHPTILEPSPQFVVDQMCRFIHEVAKIYGPINHFRSPNVLRFSRSSNFA